mmetsp:Transcript_78357/g.123418  ORF Transcript_78357/g.123418 Transcript_78357/m.123418 type:complete len:81 (-) Transcript_78357:1430-1672(-)
MAIQRSLVSEQVVLVCWLSPRGGPGCQLPHHSDSKVLPKQLPSKWQRHSTPMPMASNPLEWKYDQAVQPAVVANTTIKKT